MEAVKWSAPEFDPEPKGVLWYWSTIAVATVFLAIAVWKRDFFFALFVVLGEILVLVWGAKTPRTIEFTADDRQLTIGEIRSYPWKDFEAFSLNDTDEESDWYEFFMYFETRFKLPLKIKIDKEEYERVREKFRERLPEIEFDPTIIDTLERIIGF